MRIRLDYLKTSSSILIYYPLETISFVSLLKVPPKIKMINAIIWINENLRDQSLSWDLAIFSVWTLLQLNALMQCFYICYRIPLLDLGVFEVYDFQCAVIQILHMISIHVFGN